MLRIQSESTLRQIDAIKKNAENSFILRTQSLLTKNKFDKNDAKSISAILLAETIKNLSEKYVYKHTGKRSDKISIDNIKRSDILSGELNYFYDWLDTAITIPYYQSLGDTIGYNNGSWEFNNDKLDAGPDYVVELIFQYLYLGGILDIDLTNWRASDDTVLYLDTLETMLTNSSYVNVPDNIIKKITNGKTMDLANNIVLLEVFGEKLKEKYLGSKSIIEDRDPGITTLNSLEMMKTIDWNKLPYNSKSIGNGSAMRSGIIGLFFPTKYSRNKLLSYCIECSRITHNSAVAILGSITTGLFTSYAVEKIPINLWPSKLLKILKSTAIDNIIKNTRSQDYESFIKDKIFFVSKWEKYITMRFSGVTPKLDIKLLKNPVSRYKNLSENFSKGCDNPGGCADDCTIMAYDSILLSNNKFETLIMYSILHPGDSDTVGSIAFSLFGSYYHSFKNLDIVKNMFKVLEFEKKLSSIFTDNSLLILTKIFFEEIFIRQADRNLKRYLKKNNIIV
jgi:ADP-ribosylglycohydrolase